MSVGLTRLFDPQQVAADAVKLCIDLQLAKTGVRLPFPEKHVLRSLGDTLALDIKQHAMLEEAFLPVRPSEKQLHRAIASFVLAVQASAFKRARQYGYKPCP